ncbi:MAG: sugar kinase [Anaeromyxobacter sp.]
MELDVLCLGEAMVELNQLPSKAGEPPVYLQGFGGDTSNVAIAAARQGARAGYLSAVGQDPFGELLLELWRREGVDTALVKRDPAAHTGVYFVTHGPAGHAFSYLRAGSAASRLSPADVPADLAGARWLHVSGISQAISASACDAVFAAARQARAAGTRVSYDTNLRLKLWPLERARAVVHATVPLCDVLLPSLEDAAALTGLEDPERILSFYLGLGAPLVVLKCGAAGAWVASAAERRRIPGRPVQAVDATGAGDTFDGAFLAQLARGADPFAAAAWANCAAALSTLGHGAVAPIPRRAEVEAALSQSP